MAADRARQIGRAALAAAVAMSLGAGAAAAEPDLRETSDRDPTRISGIGAPGFEPPTLPQGSVPDMFLHVAADPRSAYVGEQITITWLLYTRHEVLKLEPSLPALGEVWSEILHELGAYVRYDEDVVDGVTYRVIVVSKRAVFPLRPGPLTIEPLTARVAGLYTPLGRATELTSDPVHLTVRPLPDGAPPGFDPSYVGVFRVEADVDRRELQAGEPLTLTLTVRGHGAIRRTTPPVLDVPGVDLRAPRDFEEIVHASTREISGERRYRYWATPQRGGSHEIPAVVIPYFDPRSGTYQEARSQPIAITVHGEPPAQPASPSDAPTSSDPRGSEVVAARSGVPAAPWPWLLAAAVLALLAAMGARRIRHARRAATADVAERFRAAELHLRAEQPTAFFGELARVLTGCIAARAGVRARSLPRDELGRLLLAHHVPEATVERLLRELERCDFARFAASAASRDDMHDALRRAHALAQELGAPARAPGPDA